MSFLSLKKIGCFIVAYFGGSFLLQAQIVIISDTNAQRLCQKLAGSGVTINNFKYRGANGAAGFFKNISTNPNLGIDSGIVLSSGYVETGFAGSNIGINNRASFVASSNLGVLGGDADLGAIITGRILDPTVLEFDFVPFGDSVAFKYIFGSEEYPSFNCTTFNDVFAFFISGPGIAGNKNMALVPGTNIPVTINSINDGTAPINTSLCRAMGAGSPFTQYYVNNSTSTNISYNGFTRVLVASAKVQPCQTYHLKIAIADVGDRINDSGVFLEAKSLNSNSVKIENRSPMTNGKPYLVEGCHTNGSINIYRPARSSLPLPVNLTLIGSAINGTDVVQIPNIVIIPAGDSIVNVPIIPIVDNLPEGTEKLKILISSGCNTTPSDSIEIEIKDYDKLLLSPKDSIGICRNGSIQITASIGYTTYTWQNDPTLSNLSIRNPIATPVNNQTKYICTATVGSCNASDSIILKVKDIQLLSKQDVNCKNGITGIINASGGWEWQAPVSFTIDNNTYQSDSTFINLPVNNYKIKIKDNTGCIDSMMVNITQAYPDLTIDTTIIAAATCSGLPDAPLTVTASGGLPIYNYSLDGINFQTSNVLLSRSGNATITVKDNNQCTATANAIVPLNNSVILNTGPDTVLCLGKSLLINATSNSTNIAWSPSTGLNNGTILRPLATPAVFTTYVATATTGICTKKDTINIDILPVPTANAGPDTIICVGKTIQLHGSGGITYRWTPTTFLNDPNIANPIVRPTRSMTYSLQVTNTFGCASPINDEVTIQLVPIVVPFAGNDTIVAIGQPLQLNAIQVGATTATEFIWSPSFGLNDPAIKNPIATLLSDQNYSVTMRTPQGCEGTDNIKIKVYRGPEIYVPSGFTPNGDGRNDILKATAVGIKDFKYFKIFNRWGQLVFTTTTSEKGWDGKVNGVLQDNQSFVWMAEGTAYNGTTIQRKGMITVIK